MLSLTALCYRLKPYLLDRALLKQRDDCPPRIELLDDQQALYADRVYLGDAAAIPLLTRVKAQPKSLILLAGMEGLCPPRPNGCDMITFSCPLVKLYNTAAAQAAQAQRWQAEYQTLAEQGGSIYDVLCAAAQIGDCAMLLLDASGQLLEAANLESSLWLSEQMTRDSALSSVAWNQLFPSSLASDCYRRVPLPSCGRTLHIRRAARGNQVQWILLAEAADDPDSPDLRCLCDQTIDFFRQRLFPMEMRSWQENTRTFQSFWEDLMERRLIHRTEIRAALSQMAVPMQYFYRVIVISFPEKERVIPYDHVLGRLREILPGCNMLSYRDDIVLLYGYEKRTFRFDLEDAQRKKLIPLLKRYNGYMAVGNGTHHVEHLGSMYLITKRTCDLAPMLQDNKEERIFLSDDFLVYSMIDLCVQRFLESALNDDIVYLTHPAVPFLTRYDREHHTNLRDVLFYYLLNDCSIAATANTLYMHRNTVNSKINQIKSLTNLDLSEPRLRQRLVLSCQVMRYYERVMQREMM